MAQSWTEDRTAQLISNVSEGVEVTQNDLVSLADVLETSTRSVGSKLRKLGYTVQKASDKATSKWSEADSNELIAFLEDNAGSYTYKEVSALFLAGQYSSKEVQGKILSLEMTENVKPAAKVVAARQYTEEQEATFLEMASSNASIEEIAAAMDKTVQSVRGKALSFIRTIEGFAMPHQEHTAAADKVDAMSALENIGDMTVEDIAEALGKSERGVKTSLTRRGITCANYDGAKRAASAKKRRDNAEASA